MPLYEYLCSDHGAFCEIRTIANRHDPAYCPICQGLSPKGILTPPRVVGDYPGYVSPATGKWIEGRAAHEEDLKRSGCHILAPGELEDVRKERAQAEQALDSAIEQTTAELYNSLPR